MAHGKKSWFCSNFSSFVSTMLKSEENEETWRKVKNMKKNEENEETLRKVKKMKKHKEKWRNMTTKQKFLSTCHLRRLIHTQMAHGKKFWFCSHFSPLFFIFLHNVEKWRKERKVKKMKKKEEKWRKWRKMKKNEAKMKKSEEKRRKMKKSEEN